MVSERDIPTITSAMDTLKSTARSVLSRGFSAERKSIRRQKKSDYEARKKMQQEATNQSDQGTSSGL